MVFSMRDTKQRILDTAERLFAKQGFSATSVRQITSAAKVNLAALHYHFGSKDQVIGAVFARRLAPLNRERLDRLASFKEAAPNRLPSLEKTVEAFIGPPLRLGLRAGRREHQFMQLMGRALTEPDHHWKDTILPQFEEVAQVFLPVFRQHLGKLPEEDFFWRIIFMIGTMGHTMSASRRLAVLSRGHCNVNDPDQAVRQMVPFLAAGLRAAAVGTS